MPNVLADFEYSNFAGLLSLGRKFHSSDSIIMEKLRISAFVCIPFCHFCYSSRPKRTHPMERVGHWTPMCDGWSLQTR